MLCLTSGTHSIRRSTAARSLPIRAATLALVVMATTSWAQDSWNVELLGTWGGRTAGRGYMDVWGYTAPDGTELAIIGATNGVAFVDVTNPRIPVERGFALLPGATHRDMRTYGTYAYAVNENGGGGLAIVDLSNPQAPILVKNWEGAFSTSHNIHIEGKYAYAVGCRGPVGTTSTTILDLSDPLNPVKVGSATRYLHDIYVRGNLAYGSAINDNGIAIYDVTDKTNPQEVSFTSYAGANTHNAWLSDDGSVLLTTDEVTGGDLHIWDVSNPTRPLAITTWTANPNAIIHNVTVKGDSAYISYYTEGLQVVDISNPANPRQVAYYDTWPGASGGFSGAWGVYPYLASGNVLVSDITSGLFVLKLVEGQPMGGFELNPPKALTALPGMQQLLYFFELQNTQSTAQNFIITAASTLGWPTEHPGAVPVAGFSTELVLVTVNVPQDLQTATVVHVEMCAQSTNAFLCASTDPTTAVQLQSFDVLVQESSVALRWSLQSDAGDEGDILVLRAAARSPDQRQSLYRGALSSGAFVDEAAGRGRSWIYTLAVDSPQGLSILAERQVTLAAPVQSRLLGNTPNPFNPQTAIHFELAQPGSVDLRVFDSRGHLLRTLGAASRPVGLQSLPWDGRDQLGNSLPSGVYFYQVRSGRWQAVGRMTLVR